MGNIHVLMMNTNVQGVCTAVFIFFQAYQRKKTPKNPTE